MEKIVVATIKVVRVKRVKVNVFHEQGDIRQLWAETKAKSKRDAPLDVNVTRADGQELDEFLTGFEQHLAAALKEMEEDVTAREVVQACRDALPTLPTHEVLPNSNSILDGWHSGSGSSRYH